VVGDGINTSVAVGDDVTAVAVEMGSTAIEALGQPASATHLRATQEGHRRGKKRKYKKERKKDRCRREKREPSD